MRRPSFRMALLLAALLGAAVMATRARKASLPGAPAPSTTWPPIADRTPSSTPAASTPAPSTPTSSFADVRTPAASTTADLPSEEVVASDGPTEVVVATAQSTGEAPIAPATEPEREPQVASSPVPEPPVTEVVRIPASGGGAAVTGAVDDPGDDAVPSSPTSSGSTWTFGEEGDTDSDRSAGSPLRADNPSLDPEPEAVLPADRIDAARSERSLIARGDESDVPPAPEPTFGTAPDPEAAATAPVHVATPVEAEPDEPLAIPHRPGHDDEGSAS